MSMFPHAPRGEHMPITCTYPYSRGKPQADEADLPMGWTMEWLGSDDPIGELAAARFTPPPTYIGTHEDGSTYGAFEAGEGREVASYLYLRDAEGQLVATWDEGRWWTPEESEAFLLMLKVPAAAEFGLGRNTPQPRREE